MKLNKRLEQVTQEFISSTSSLLLSSYENIYYLTEIDLSVSSRFYALLLKEKEKPILFINELYREYFSETDETLNFVFYKDMEDPLVKITNYLDFNVNVTIDYGLSVNGYDQLINLRTDIEIEKTNYIEKMRAIKSKEEINNLKHISLISDTVFNQLVQLIQIPATESAIKYQLIKLFEELDIYELNFDPIVATGTNSSIPHYRARNVVLSEGEPTVVDIGGKYNGYCSDVTRMLVMGNNPNELFEEDYKILESIQSNVIEMIKPGMYFKELDIYVREELSKRGLVEYYNHNLGHGIGIASYEYPYIHNKTDSIIEEGMTITIGPGIYKPNKYGIRVEDVVLVTENGGEKLNKISSEILRIGT